MKNNNKSISTLRVVPCAVRQTYNGEAAAAGEAAECLNMREREDSLQVMGSPVTIASISAGDRLLLVHDTSFGQRLLTIGNAANSLNVKCGDAVVLTLDAVPVGACQVGDYAVIATSGRLWMLRALSNGSYSVLDPDEALPQITLGEVDASTATVSVEACDFATPYDLWPARITTADSATLLAALRRAFSSAASTASTNGRYTGAILARYGVRLFDDSYLWLSAPVLLGSDTLGSATVTADVTVTDSHFAGVPAATLSVPSYALGITVHGGIAECWHGIVKAVDVMVTSAMGLGSDGSSLVCHSATSTTGTRRNVLEYGLKAPSASVAASALLGSKWQVVATTSHLDALGNGRFEAANVANSASCPFPTAVTRALVAPMAGNITISSEQCAALHKCIARRLVPSAVLSHGGRLMAGVAGWQCRNPWGLAQVCSGDATTGSCRWQSTVTLATDHGEATVVLNGSLPFTPRLLSPVMAYPDVRATHMRVEVTALSTGAVTAWESDLWPVSSQGMAVAFTTAMAAVDLASDTAVEASTANAIDGALGTVAVTVVGNPLVVASTHTVGGETVRALAAACRPIYSSGFGRYPVYVFTRSALYALPQLTSGAYGDARLLHRGGIGEGGAVACGDSNVWFVDAADGCLCRVDGAKCSRVVRGVGADAQLAWNDVEGELVVLATDGTLSVVQAGSGRTAARSLTASSLYGADGHVLAVTAGGMVLDFAAETADPSVSVCYRSHPVELNGGFPCRPQLALWRVMAQNASVRLAVRGERGSSCHGFVVGSVSASGNISAPIAIRLIAQPLRTVRLQISGNLPSGALLFPVTLLTKVK